MKRSLRSLGLLLLYITATNNLCFSRHPLPVSFVVQPSAIPHKPGVQIYTFPQELVIPASATSGPVGIIPSFDTAIIITAVNIKTGEAGLNPQTGFKDIPPVEPGAKSCACEVLKVNSKNQRNLRIAVLVEKTSIISESDRALVRQLLEKEKRYMKYFFYEEMKTLSNMIAPTDCQTLYKKLHSAAAGLQLYQVLDADIKRHL